MARKFVLEWMNRRSPPKENAVIRQLARIDLHIRRRWWRNYITNPTWTFTQAIEAAESLADNQWSFDYSTGLFASYQGAPRLRRESPGKTPGRSPDLPREEAMPPQRERQAMAKAEKPPNPKDQKYQRSTSPWISALALTTARGLKTPRVKTESFSAPISTSRTTAGTTQTAAPQEHTDATFS